MKMRTLTTPALLVALLVGMFAGPAVAQTPPDLVVQDSHVHVAPAEVEVAPAVVEAEEDEVGVEVLGVAEERQLAVTGVDALLLTAIALGLIGLGILSFRVGRRAPGQGGPDTAG